MPEYLAPGVYVEETSFRPKSIEGVSTSTTGFVGLTRRGPARGTPPLITSLGDFERIYGTLDDLRLTPGTNYLAHAVRNYFDNGGGRLYVSRVFLPVSDTNTGVAVSPNVVAGTGAAEQARIVARFPGDAGNGRVTLREVAAPVSRRSLDSAPEGTLIRIGGGGQVATPARIQGSVAPFSLPNDGVLLLTVNGADVQITLHGEPAEAIGGAALADPVVIPAGTTWPVTLDAVAQTLTLAGGADVSLAPAALVARLNTDLRGGYARLTDDGRLVIGSDRRGTAAAVSVAALDVLGFAAPANVLGSANAANTVPNALAVTADDVNELLIDAGIAARASQSAANRLVLATVDVGAGRSLAIRAGGGSIHIALGLTAGPAVTGAAGATPTYFVKTGNTWRDAGDAALDLATVVPDNADFLTLTVLTEDADGQSITYEEMGFDRRHPRWIGSVLAAEPTRLADALENLYALQIGAGVSAFELRAGLFAAGPERVVMLSEGNDGVQPNAGAYERALREFERLEDIAIVAAPGYSAYTDSAGIQQELIEHAERRRAYRIAVLDVPPDRLPGEAREVRAGIDSKHAALYYPWVVISNPLARPGDDSIPRELTLPPSGFVCGIYARTDVERGVFKAPANEVVRGALRFETDINFAEQESLNPVGVNCLRYFPGRGFRLWGARTASSDPEWKYVSVRRYFNYLEASIDRGTQWAVFEPNGERLWANIRETVAAFLYNEWVSGALLGATPQEAFFVRCDRSTMTQNDLDNGRLICLVGVAVIKPAEFVIFRIGQKTADART